MDFEIENLLIIVIVWLFAVILLFLPDLVGLTGWDLTTKIIGAIVMIPVAYFIVQWQASK